MTDFFEHQRRARRRSRRLLGQFGLAVGCVILALYLTSLLVCRLQGWPLQGRPDHLLLLGGVALVGGGWIGAVSGWTLRRLAARGGTAVAVLMGGRPVRRDTPSGSERVLLNVVEEMAVAAGVPVPWVYVLDDEPGVNAFAAGYGYEDAVICVTAPALTLLTRDELQGVVGHEFSHILNGDIRLNMRLAGFLAGIRSIAEVGRWISRLLTTRRWRPGPEEEEFDRLLWWLAAPMLAVIAVLVLYVMRAHTALTAARVAGVLLTLGVALMLVGGVGVLVSRLLQAAVSRQREFLADAAAVQFTRNPAGLAGALRKIGRHAGGSMMLAAAAGALRHFFFAAPMSGAEALSFFPTHPPLEERIRRLTQGLPPPSPVGDGLPVPPAMAGAVHPEGRALAYSHELIEVLPAPLYEAAHEPVGAEAVVCGLLLDADPAVAARQAAALPAAVQGHLDVLRPLLRSLRPQARLPLVELALPSLRALEAPDRRRLRAQVHRLAAYDGHFSIFEFALSQLIAHRLEAGVSRPAGPPPTMPLLLPDAALLLSALAYAGHAERADAQRAFEAGAVHMTRAVAELQLLDPALLTSRSLGEALRRLSATSYTDRQRLVDACAHGVLADGTVGVEEAELLRAVVMVLDFSVPPFLPTVIRGETARASG